MQQLQFQRSLVGAILPSLVLGQQPLSILYSNLRALIVANSGLADTTNTFDYFPQTLTVQLPQNSIEAYVNDPPCISTIGNASRLGTKVAAMLVPAAGFDESGLYLTDMAYVLREKAPDQDVQVRLLRRDPRSSFNSTAAAPRSIAVTCSKGNVTAATYGCPGQFAMTVRCDGVFHGVVKSTCPYNYSIPVCAVLLASSDSMQPKLFCSTSNFDLDTISCDCHLPAGHPDFYVNSILRNVTAPASVTYFPAPGQQGGAANPDPLYQYRYVLGSILIAIMIVAVASVVALLKKGRAKKSGEEYEQADKPPPEDGIPQEDDRASDENFLYGDDGGADESKEVADEDGDITAPEPVLMTPSEPDRGSSEIVSPSEIRLSLGRPSALEGLIHRMKELFVQASSSSSNYSCEDKEDDSDEEERSTYVSLSNVYGRGGSGGVSYEIDTGIQTALKTAASPRT